MRRPFTDELGRPVLGRQHDGLERRRRFNDAELFAQSLVLGPRPALAPPRRTLPARAGRLVLFIACAALAAGGIAWARSALKRF